MSLLASDNLLLRSPACTGKGYSSTWRVSEAPTPMATISTGVGHQCACAGEITHTSPRS
jgi:hypothetical protein